ncbi:hypothetical protein KIW84_033987 [Lathyrus oleraceus]|uniref:DUF4283 domain-containing protein n=1 Tax=Pisum sativum TaxID=3888 RepID=A0A9D5B0M8_PEA|nr:hypothetical protein KIW84_033987 [Pisum sativum]
MWSKKGVINIIDLSNDYYLIIFSHDDDHNATLANGTRFIYDHYLTLKEWGPDFHPASNTIENVEVSVQIFGFPSEYYDKKILSFIGNMIGKTVKVDKNTLSHERGKFDHYKEGCPDKHVQRADNNKTEAGKQQGMEDHSN